jgi:hypothetical protein
MPKAIYMRGHYSKTGMNAVQSLVLVTDSTEKRDAERERKIDDALPRKVNFHRDAYMQKK